MIRLLGATLLCMSLAMSVGCSSETQSPSAVIPIPHNASLTWDLNSESDLAGYNIYRFESPGAFVSGARPLATVTTTEFVDTTGTIGIIYYYVVTAFDTADPSNESDASNEVSKLF